MRAGGNLHWRRRTQARAPCGLPRGPFGIRDWRARCFFRFVAVVLPWVEIVSGGFLLADLWTETAGVLVSGLCFVFVLVLGQAVLRGLELKCGCFGELAVGWFERPKVALLRAFVLLGASLWLLLCLPPGDRETSPMSARSVFCAHSTSPLACFLSSLGNCRESKRLGR